MCIICVSKKGERQPTVTELRTMYRRNPHGAGYMYARDGFVFIHKGFMTEDDFVNAVKAEKFDRADSVVYHTRISTQANRPEMTHPFPVTAREDALQAFDVRCSVGIAHNGIIRLTSEKNDVYSDTALFIRDYVTRVIRMAEDVRDENCRYILDQLANPMFGSNKFALLTGDGNIETIGDFIEDRGLLFSNGSYKNLQRAM